MKNNILFYPSGKVLIYFWGNETNKFLGYEILLNLHEGEFVLTLIFVLSIITKIYYHFNNFNKELISHYFMCSLQSTYFKLSLIYNIKKKDFFYFQLF